MADNVAFQTSATATPPDATSVATRLLSLSGDSTNVQVINPIALTGSEGSWTAREFLIADDAAFTPGTNAVAMIGAEFDDTGPDSVDEGDAGALRMSARRELYVQLRDAAGNERGLNVDGSGNITVNVTGTVTVGSHAVTNAGTFAVQVDGSALTALQLIDDTIFADDAAFTLTSSKVSMAGAIRDDALGALAAAETDAVPLRVDANGALWVIPSGTVTVTASNLDVQSGGADLATTTQAGAIQTAVEIMDDWDESDRAKVNPIVGQAGVQGGSGAVSNTTQRVVLATDVALPAGTNAVGKLLPPDIDITGHTNYMKKYYTSAGAATDGIIWSPAAGKRWHVTCLTVNVSAACTVTFEDDKAGGDEAVMKFEFAANSGVVIPFGEKYPWASGEDAADLLVTTSAGNIYITAVGYEI